MTERDARRRLEALGRENRQLRERMEAADVMLARLRPRLSQAHDTLSFRLGKALIGATKSLDELRSLPRVLRSLEHESRRRRANREQRDPGPATDRARVASELRRALLHAKHGSEWRVLHFSKAFSVPSETFTYAVIAGLERIAALDNYVMCFTRELPEDRPFAKTVQLHGHGRVTLESAAPGFVALVETVLARLRPDIVHCHFGWVGVPFLRVLEAAGVRLPVVITMHGTDVNTWPFRYPWYRSALESIGTKPWVSLTTHSNSYREKLVALGVPANKITVIPNSFADRFTPCGDRGFRLGGHFRAICVARMDVWKGHEPLLRAFAMLLRDAYANASLTLVGYGPQERELQELSRRLNITRNVRFFGRASHHEVPALLRNHDVYVQPSIRHPLTRQEEGQPIAVLEAIASGMPVIVTDTGAMAETVRVGAHPGNAWVVPPGDSDALARALYDVVRSTTPAALRQAYVQTIRERHSEHLQVQRTLDVYRGVIGAAQAGTWLAENGRE